MFKKILIANRGEIALRIIRACRELGIETVAVYSEADTDCLHVRFADTAVCIGPAKSAESYLDPKRIIPAAEITGAEAIHPGYGFLAENADFADICSSCDLVFIGPPPEVIRALGDKVLAKKTMKEADVPVVPGSEGGVVSVAAAKEVAEAVGYPIILKAAAGGGGRGMRVANTPAQLEKAFHTARMEAKAAFNNPEVYLEKYLVNPRHVEIQILADEHGNIVHLGERDCTVQRRHQKLIEESPSPIMTPTLREKMGKAAILGAKRAGYRNAGTVEFLVDSDGSFYFMEMNTRVQVEHPVTEEVTDIDIIVEQLRIASGEKLSLTQDQVKLSGNVIECRINAENPDTDFTPSPGMITAFHPPGGHGVRVDTHVYAKYVVPPFYDSLLAKLIVRGINRNDAIAKMLRALDEFIIEGIHTTIDFHKKVLADPVFQSGTFDTGFVEDYYRRTKSD
ncbi:MAG: acetyl-CoA carboxylase biotin carboxylase subunit [candidate division Zixibacteria bacterium]|nr:acetyl-CoA carboxylase biotin carboxylase subunit [candidate division Zixibacteria bacterium]